MEIKIKPISVNIKSNKKFNSRYITPPPCHQIEESFLKYKYAADLAKDVVIDKGVRHFVIIDGTFVFGDFIEALIVEKNYLVKHMLISTLSMNQNNVDSLKNLIVGDYVQNLDLIVSDYFYSHERHELVPYLYEKLDIDDKFQLAVAGTHCKICAFETECGKKIVIHGSSNLRSSSNIEQFIIEESEAIYDFNKEIHDNIVEKYKTIKKSLRYKKLWAEVENIEQRKQTF
jgi:hypothetical protein